MSNTDTRKSDGAEDGAALPHAGRGDDSVQGHWLLARLGKRVLRPGGVELTRVLLAHADVADHDVVEFAPGLGRTAMEIIARHPRSYLGAEEDPAAAQAVRKLVADHGKVRVVNAAQTGLPNAGTDVVIGEAMLTMQSDKAKHAIVAEAARLLRPGGRYAIHELALTPDDLPNQTKTDIRRALAGSIKVNARPLTISEWRRLLADHGLVVDHVETAPMALLQPRRLVSDEGAVGALRFAMNVLTHHDARRRVLRMRRTFRVHRKQLAAVAIVAQKPADR
jgi:SAM-dependent methyltransferase